MPDDEWLALGSALTGTTIGRTRVNDAVVFLRSIRHDGRGRAVTDELVTETLNLASGLGSSKRIKNNALTTFDGELRPLWLGMTELVAEVVVDDLRRRIVPERGNADPVVVLMVQEARPLLVDAIARRMSTQFARDIATLFVTQTPDPAAANAAPQRYHSEYGNALIATTPLQPAAAMNFTHEPENRMFVAASLPVGAGAVTVGTYHAQIDAAGREGHQAEEQRVLEMLVASLAGPIVIGGDFNNRSFAIAGLAKHGSFRAPVDAFVTRGVQTRALGTGRTRMLRAPPYELDHRRVARKWQVAPLSGSASAAFTD